jgi:hypothetical protein
MYSYVLFLCNLFWFYFDGFLFDKIACTTMPGGKWDRESGRGKVEEGKWKRESGSWEVGENGRGGMGR